MTKRGRPRGSIPSGMCRVLDAAAFREVIATVFAFAAETPRGGGVWASDLLEMPRSLLYRYRRSAPLYVHPQLAANLEHFAVTAAGDWPAESRQRFRSELLPAALDMSAVGDLQPTGGAIGRPSRTAPPTIAELIGDDLQRARRQRPGSETRAIEAASLAMLIDAADVVCGTDDIELVQERLKKDKGRSGVTMFVYPWGKARGKEFVLLNFVRSRRTARDR